MSSCHGEPRRTAAASGVPVIALVGNPNVGKSAVFGILTGRYAVVSNYPGTTVELSIGNVTIHGTRYEVIDTPGANSLTPSSEDERVARDILFEGADVRVIQIADAKNLDRALMLTFELAELGLPTVLLLNMWDELSSRLLSIDVAQLRRILGIPVVRTVATQGMGFHHVREAISNAEVPSVDAVYGDAVDEAAAEVQEHLASLGLKAKGTSLVLLAGDKLLLKKLSPDLSSEAVSDIEKTVQVLREKLPVPTNYFLRQRRAQAVRDICSKVVKRAADPPQSKTLLARTLPFAFLAVALFFIGYKFTDLLLAMVQAASRRELPIPWLRWAGGVGIILLSLVTWFRRPIRGRSSPAEVVSRLTLSPLSAIPIIAVVLWLIYVIVGQFGAGTVVDFIESKVFGSPVAPSGGFDVSLPIPFAGRSIDLLHVPFNGLNYYLASAMLRVLRPESFIYRLLLDVDAGLISVGLRYSIAIVLPIVSFFFLAFAIMEDSGYLPRLSVLMDGVFRAMGMNGKAVLPMVLGLGCDTMATLSTRILDTRKERVITTLLLALAIPCSAQLGLIAGILTQVSPITVAIYVLTIVSQLFFVGLLASRIIPGQTSDFLLELPPIRLPRPGNVLLKTVFRVRWFLLEAVPLFLLGTAVLFFTTEIGLLRLIERFMSPLVVGVLGLPAETAKGFLLGFLRRDYGSVAIFDMFRAGAIGTVQVLVALVVITLFVPCLANLLVIIKEQGARKALMIVGFILPYAFVVGAAVRFIANLIGIQD